MDVRIVGIPMIDSHPIQSRAKVGFHLLGEVAVKAFRSVISPASSGETMNLKW
jgi:hypothetical protein